MLQIMHATQGINTKSDILAQMTAFRCSRWKGNKPNCIYVNFNALDINEIAPSKETKMVCLLLFSLFNAWSGKKTLGRVFWRETQSVNIVSTASYKMNHNAAVSDTNVVHFSHYYRLNFDKPCDALIR